MDKQARRTAAIATIKEAAARWDGTFIPRDRVPEFTGGAFSTGHLANLDSLGKGPEVAFKIGRKQCYTMDSLVDWLIARLEV